MLCSMQVTLIQNLEQFGIDPNEFAHQIQLAAASSTSGKNIRITDIFAGESLFTVKTTA